MGDVCSGDQAVTSLPKARGILEVALVSGSSPLGDIDLHLGGRNSASSTFLVTLTVRTDHGLRDVQTRRDRAGAVYLDDHVRNASGTRAMPTRLALPFAIAQIGTAAWLGDTLDELRTMLAALDTSPDPEPPEALPAPTSEAEMIAFMSESPFPTGLTEAEIGLLGLERPPTFRVTKSTTSIARTRKMALEIATRDVAKLAGTRIETRIRRVTGAVAQVLAWTGQESRARLVDSWSEAPLAKHPLARELLLRAMLYGGLVPAGADALRPAFREEIFAEISERTRRDLLRLELGASLGATMSAWFQARAFREELPRRALLRQAALAGADAAIAEEGTLQPVRARDAIATVLSNATGEETTTPSIRGASEIATKSVAKLAEASERMPIREWARGPLDESMPDWMFVHGPKR